MVEIWKKKKILNVSKGTKRSAAKFSLTQISLAEELKYLFTERDRERDMGKERKKERER